MTHTVLLVSLGPVQEFIASARRCRDLWFGSWLLSELAREAAKGMTEFLGRGGEEALIFPGVSASSLLEARSNAPVGNKLLIRVPGDSVRAGQVAEAGRRAMQEGLETLAKATFCEVGQEDRQRSRHFREEIALQQVAEMMEYLWVAVTESEGGYSAARSQAERLLRSRKNTRMWGQPSWSDAVPKSSLDGVRESVLGEELFGAGTTPAALRRHYGVHAAERLCGVGLLKRWGRTWEDETPRFFSTSHVAALPLLRRLAALAEKDAPTRNAIESFREDVKDAFPGVSNSLLRGAPSPCGVWGHTDGQILFASRLAEVAEEEGLSELEAQTRCKRVERALRAVLLRIQVGEPLPYYAVLVADGDRMGRVIDRQHEPASHRELSQRLEEFAKKAREIVEDAAGTLLYAGGDDVLALLPLDSTLACAQSLRQEFASLLTEFTDAEGESPTLSVGLAVVHHLEPLGEARQAANQAEKLAKTLRNALGIRVCKRGGAPIELVGSWEGPGSRPSLVERLEEWTERHRLDQIPDKAGLELMALRATVGATGAGYPVTDTDLKALAWQEAKRILRRKRGKHGAEELGEPLVNRMMGEKPSSEEPGVWVEELGRELWVASLLARARNQALGNRELPVSVEESSPSPAGEPS